MEQPRIPPPTARNTTPNNKKRSLPKADQEDFEEPCPVKKLAINFEQSLGFSQTYCSNSKTVHLPKQEDLVDVEHDEHSSFLDFSTELRKAQLLTPPEDKFQTFKSLLPIHLTTKLHPNYERLLNIAAQTDQILMALSKHYNAESFENIKNDLQDSHNLIVSFEVFSQINFLIKGYYSFSRDPLNNLVIGFPFYHESVQIRKYKLRQELYRFAVSIPSEEIQVSEQYREIPDKMEEISKRQTFFPAKKKHQVQRQPQKLNQNFVNHLQASIQRKQELISQAKLSSEVDFANNVDMQWFVSEVEKMYKHHKVGHIFRANIVGWFDKLKISVESTLSMLHIIEKTHLFLRPKEKTNKHLIYEIKSQERSLLLAKLSAT